MGKSKTNVAYEILKEGKGGLAFARLWEEVCQRLNINEVDAEEMISGFYTDISLDGRFITLGENVWDLRENHSFDKVHIDMNDIYSDEDIIEGDEGVISKEDTDEKLFEEADDE